VTKTLKEKGIEVVVAGELGAGARTILEISGIRAVQVDPGVKVNDALDKAFKQQLLTAP
jgi:predicted Fe-Mo cluster-binding NifX family protein